jgi:hypothetical protein
MPRTAEMPRALQRGSSNRISGGNGRARESQRIAKPSSREERTDRSDIAPLLVNYEELTAPAGHKACPSPADPTLAPLTQQFVTAPLCSGRQDSGYHKCAGCQHFTSQRSFVGTQLRPENGPGTLERAKSAEA